ncbi:MAG: DUF4352 domain-containing protein [Mycobacterium sp.]
MFAVTTSVTGCLGSLHSSSPTASLNEEVRVGAFAFTVTSVNIGTPKVGIRTAQGVFVVVEFTAKNIGDTPRSVYCQNQKLKDLSGRTYDDAVNVGSGEDLFSINPGKQVRFSCAFDVPKGTLPGTVEIHDSAYSKGVPVTVLERR